MSKKDVESSLRGLEFSIAIGSLIGSIWICVIIYIALRRFLRPIDEITGMIDKMHDLDLTERTSATFTHIRSRIDGINEAMANVINSVGDIETVAADMASHSKQQSASTSNALDDCRQMIDIAEQFNREGTEVENSGKELKELSLKLDETVEKFRV